MTNRVRIIRHEAVPDTGSYEVRFGDGRAWKFFYFDDVAARRLRPEILTSVVALDAGQGVRPRDERQGWLGTPGLSQSDYVALSGILDQ